MAIVKFRLQWKDLNTGEIVDEVKEFKDTPSMTAKEWAEDYCYMRADKGWYNIQPYLKGNKL